MKNNKISIALLTFVFICSTGFSQRNTDKDNVARLGLLSLLFGNISVGYERALSDNSSVALNVSYLIPRKFPSYGTLEDEIDIDETRMSSLSIVPEFRYYPGKKSAPEGFYVGPYLKYSRYSMSYSGSYEEYQDMDVTGTYASFGGGIQIGYQWLISDLISIDFYFFGIGVTSNKIIFDITSDDPLFEFVALQQEIETEAENIPIFGNNIETEVGDDYIKATSKFIFLDGRFGVTVGIAF